MTEKLPLFPLNTVLFPGVTVPLHVFEDRYRALVHSLLRIEDPAQRLFGSCAIREGYEVGDRGGQSLHRIGCLLQLTEIESHGDGTFDIEAVARGRLRLESIETSGEFLAGAVSVLEDEPEQVDPALDARARAAFEGYRNLISELRGESLFEGDLPRDATYLSWSLAATVLIPLRERQSLLEAATASQRLRMLIDLLHSEKQAASAIPSLPATEVARSGWSPN